MATTIRRGRYAGLREVPIDGAHVNPEGTRRRRLAAELAVDGENVSSDDDANRNDGLHGTLRGFAVSEWISLRTRLDVRRRGGDGAHG